MIDNNEDIGTLEQADNVLSGLTSRAPKNQLTVDDVYAGTGNYRMSPEEMDVYDQYRQMRSSAPTGALGLHDYYPDSNNNVAAGNFSISGEGSSLSGSTYAPGGGLIPLAMLDARDLAIKQAGLQKQKELDDFHKQFKAPTSKLVGINENLTDAYFSHQQEAWQRALRKSSGDPNKASKLLKSDPSFWAKEKSFHDLAKNGDAVVDYMAKMQTRLDKGDVITPAERQVMSELQGTLDPESDKFKDLSQTFRRAQADNEFGTVANKMIKDTIASKIGGFADKSTDEQNRIMHYEIEKLGDDQKEAILNDLKYIYQGSRNYSPEYIEKNAGALMNWKKKNSTMSVSNKPKEDDNDNYTEEDISKEPSYTNVYTRNQSGPLGQVNVEENVSVGDYGVTHKKPIPVIIPNGSHVYINDDKNGLIKSTEISPNAKTQLFKTELVKVYDGSAKEHRGTPVSEKQISEGRKWKWAPMTKGVVTETDADGNKIEKQIFVPAKEVENVLVKKRDKDGNVVKGIPVDKLYKEAERRNAELNAPEKTDTDKDVKSVPSASEADWLKAGWNKNQIDQAVKEGKIKIN